jgi:hypothetical protein
VPTKQATVWIEDDWARRITGAKSRGPEPSRWFAVGTVDEVDVGGIWLTSQRIEEHQSYSKTVVAYKKSKPRTLLIRWKDVVLVEYGSEPTTMGFQRR